MLVTSELKNQSNLELEYNLPVIDKEKLKLLETDDPEERKWVEEEMAEWVYNFLDEVN